MKLKNDKSEMIEKHIKDPEKLKEAKAEFKKIDKKLQKLQLEKSKLEAEINKEMLKPMTVIVGLAVFVIMAITVVNLVIGVVDFVKFFKEQGHDIDVISAIIFSQRILLSVVESVICFLIGVFLFARMRKKGAISCLVAISVLFFYGVLTISSIGLQLEFWICLAEIVILMLLSAYLDPVLIQERILRGKRSYLKVHVEAQEGILGRDLSGKGYIKLNMVNFFWIFFITSIFGIWIEYVYCGIVDHVWCVRNGMVFGVFSPIYGFGAVLISVALNRFHKKNPILIFLAAAFIGTAFEFFVSWYFEFSFGIRPWNYSHTFMSLDGRVNLAFWFFWGVLGLLWVKVFMPLVLKLINLIPWNLRYSLTAVFFVLMLLNSIITLQAFNCWQQRSRSKPVVTEIQQFYEKNFNDSFMEEKFPNMVIEK
ncbi:MAG: hypothetical protein HUJ51_00945 [Eggerthellaceae bacterium]|nr:hypothetical protein [Eggerthellaceae bacterium]